MVSSSDVKSFELLSLPLTGRTLIEASAGTGKTYSLAFIYLRLLLGIGNNNYPRALSVNEILVVTFTKAATEELRSRIRLNIYQLRAGLQKGFHDDVSYQQLIDLIKDPLRAINVLTESLQAMDDAAINTIHSFCQRILTTHAFESGILFQQALVTDEQQLRLQVVQDFWRHHFTCLDKPLAHLVLQSWSDPYALLSELSPYLSLESIRTASVRSDLLPSMAAFYQDNLNRINKLKKDWQKYASEITDLITQSGVSKQSYSSRNLPNWLIKVSNWAETQTEDFNFPPALNYFSQNVLMAKTKEGQVVPQHKIFEQIETLLATPLELSSQFLRDIAVIIYKEIHREKTKRAEMGFDDLLVLLNRALKGQYGKQLANSIATEYCVALIDEFQDTDPVQYQIFDLIYQDKKQTGLLFIGDPKQAIYSFRGADIFTYLQAKKSTADNYFTMDRNWRSSGEMVLAVNNLFSNKHNPFVFDEIPFLPMHAADKNQHKSFLINAKKSKALSAYLLPDEITTVDDYLQQMAICCAKQVVMWLSPNSMLINSDQERRQVTANDIAILVSNKKEAEIIQQELMLSGIQSVYLSNHNSVFDSAEAKSVLCLLQAALMPENESALRGALMTKLLGLSMHQIERITEEQEYWESLVEEFKQYQSIWLNYGILVMLRSMMKKRHMAENILAEPYGERILTNVMHLSELLQEASYELDSPHALVRWLNKQIKDPDANLENHEQRLESDENLVRIITIHKSKGLEFPLVWLPFIANYRNANTNFYHDRQNDFKQTYALSLTDEIKEQIEEERLAEDLRLLYVAITRSIYHCSIGIAKLKKCDSAIYYLLNHDWHELEKLTECIEVDLSAARIQFKQQAEIQKALSAKKFTRMLLTNWRVTSYSELQKQRQTVESNLAIETVLNEGYEDHLQHLLTSPKNIHYFPSSAYVGTLFHKMMEQIHLKNIDELVLTIINKLNLSLDWQPALVDWAESVISAPLNSKGLHLKQIFAGNFINELQFYLPIKQSVTAMQLDKLCKTYDPLSQQCNELDFISAQGMLKGFIDLVFEWEGKFYLVDYKSNRLGDSQNAYQQESLHHAMCEHRYDLQYQLYSLALHRFLKSRLANYQYGKNFGGVYYLFLRGMPNNGIFHYLPSAQFIEQLDQLFDS